MSTISEKVQQNWTDTGDTDNSSLQQLKAKKNKSNLFLIKSYSFIDKTNNNNNNNNINNNNNNNNNIHKSAKMSTADIHSPDMEPFVDLASLVLSQPSENKKSKKETRLKKPKKQKQPKTKTKTKAKRDKVGEEDREDIDTDINEQEAQLLRRNLHEYEELLDHLPSSKHGSLPRPQSLPAKVHFESRLNNDNPDEVPIPPKRLGANIKRESFLRQSLQSIRRSFGSNKHSSKLSMAASTSMPSPVPSRVSSNASTTSSTSSAVSSSTSTSTSSAISLLTKAQAHNHILDEFLPTPVVLLLNDDPITNSHKKYFGQNTENGLVKRSTNSVVNSVPNGGNCGPDDRATTSMAPLQFPSKGAATTTTTTTTKDNSGSTTTTTGTGTGTGTTLTEQQQRLQQYQLEQLQQRRQQYIQQHSLPETIESEDSSLPQSYSTSGAPLQPSGSAHSLGSSPNTSPRNSQRDKGSGTGTGSGSTAVGKGNNTAKQHDQQTSAVAAISSTSAAAGVNATSSQGAASSSSVVAATPPEKEKEKEKEKKRKEVSSSRVKKFHRHFSQVSKDEKLINYFSCALVGDIPLQGHLYITEEHFAFYSNVFGYVTKVVIPTSSVTKISKEKTAKIIPNAVGVATADERHVFGSFISREAAFRLMCTVCTQLATGNEILPKPLIADVELTEEYLLDDESSCSISGNESPPHLRSAAAAAAAAAAGGASEPEIMLRQRTISDRHSDLQGKSMLTVDNGQLVGQSIIRSSAPPVVQYEEQSLLNGSGSRQMQTTTTTHSNSASASSSGPTSSSSSPITVVGGSSPSPPPTTLTTTTTTLSSSTTHNTTIGGRVSSVRSYLRLQLPTLTELHVLYLGIMLAIMLALFSVFLLYRILDIEAKTHLYNTPVDFNLRSGNDEDLFAEALRWQKELQDKSTAEAQHILSKNLEQISKVRRSLETLSMLIHDRRSGYAQPETETEMDMDMEMEIGGTVHEASSISDFSD